MNLLKSLSKLLLEFRGRTFYLPRLKKGDRTLSVGVSAEQMFKRSGDVNPEDPENANILKRMMLGDWRSGVYNMWLRDIIERNFDTVYDTINEHYDFESDNRIIFYGHNKLIGDVEFVADIEVIDIDHMALKIITSGVSLPNRRFFFTKEDSRTVDLIENKINQKILEIHLEN
jgi:hypothetical protein